MPLEIQPYTPQGTLSTVADIYNTISTAANAGRQLRRYYDKGRNLYNDFKFEKVMPKSRYHGGSYGGRSSGGNRIINRKRFRRGRRRGRRLRWGTRVRREALKLGEGLRYTERNTAISVDRNDPVRYRLFAQLRTAVGSDVATSIEQLGESTIGQQGNSSVSASGTLMTGLKAKMRGVKINMMFVNQWNDTDATPPAVQRGAMDVRIICGWRKGNQSIVHTQQGDLTIFKNKGNTESGLQLANTEPLREGRPWDSMKASLDKQKYIFAKDMVFRLGPNSQSGTIDTPYGPFAKKVSFWWEFNNKELSLLRGEPNSGDLFQQRCNWYPMMWIYHTPAFADVAAGKAFCEYNVSWRLYWRDPNSTVLRP